MNTESSADVRTRRPIRIWDLVLSVILLFLGLFVSLVAAFASATLARGVGESIIEAFEPLSAPHLAYIYGAIVALMTLGVFATSLVFTIRLIRARRVSFWLPIVGIVVMFLVIPLLYGWGLAIVNVALWRLT